VKTVILFTITVSAAAANAQTLLLPGYTFDVVASGLSNPVALAFVGPDQFLTTEKNTGKVKRFLNGVYQGDAIDLGVANNNERGLLGICLDPDFSGTGYVYLYYSHSSSNTDGGSWTDNRVEKFFFNGTTLVFVQTLITFPFDSLQSNGPNHNGGIIAIGPDRKLYICTGDLDRGYYTNPTIEQNYSPTNVAGVGGIKRIELDGSIPLDNPFIMHPDVRIKSYYCYGVRNPFGIAFDPLTNKLWFTENGPDQYDEINIGGPGLNSGWRKIMGPDSRGAAYFENQYTDWNASDLIMLPGAYYQDPVFSFFTPIGITAIAFLNSIQFAPSERYDCVCADINLTNIYLFDMNAQRNGFNLKPGTEDFVADNNAERDQYRLGYQFGNVTDLKIGPDGFLYVVGYISGSVYRIRPRDVVYPAQTVTISHGRIAAGTLNDTRESDDRRLDMQQGVTYNGGPPSSVEAEFSFTSRIASTTQVSFSLESSSSGAPLTQSAYLYNFQNQSYELIDSRLISQSDTPFSVTITTNPNRFIDSATKRMKAKIIAVKSGSAQSGKWRLRIDELLLRVRE